MSPEWDSKWLSVETTSEWNPTIRSLFKKLRLLQELNFQTTNAHTKAAVYILSWIQRNFNAQGSMAQPGGWKPLAASTVARRLSQERAISGRRKHRQRGSSIPQGTVRILENNGWLRNNWKVNYGKDFFAVQSMVDYGVYHDSDATPRRKIPQRKILPRAYQIQEALNKIYGESLWEIIGA